MFDSFRRKIEGHVRSSKKLLKLEEKGGCLRAKFKKLQLDENKGSSKVLSLDGVQEEFRRMYKKLRSEEEETGLHLRGQFDSLRRDISKNQFNSIN